MPVLKFGGSSVANAERILSVCNVILDAEKVGRAIRKALSQHGKIKCDVYISKINQQGAKIIGK